MLAAGVAGCSLLGEETPTPGPSVSSPTVTPSESATPESPAPPALDPAGDAEANLAYFDEVVQSVWAGDRRVQGMAYIDALTEAGFDRAAMAVTFDTTTIGRVAESIQFSVAWGETECLIGQVGPSTGDPVVVVAPQLAEGRCLVGKTREIGG